MASAGAAMMLVERETILNYVYNSYNTEHEFGLTTNQLQSIFTNVRGVNLNLSQIEASMKYVCACQFLCDREELLDVLNEMDRRYYLAHDLQWEFALLDYQRKGAISKSDTAFLFKMVYGDFFSRFKFERMLNKRKVPSSDISFEEIEVALCNIPTKDWIEELMHEEEKELQEHEYIRKENERKLKEFEDSKRREEELKRQMEEEDKKLKEVLARKKEMDAEIEKKKAEDKKRKQEEEKRQAEEEKHAKIMHEASEAERIAREKVEHERLAAELAEKQRLDAEKAKQERIASEQAEKERAAEKAEQEKLAAEKAEQEKLAAEQAEQEKLAAEKVEQEKLAAEKAEQERLVAEKAEQEESQAIEQREEPPAAEVETKKNERAIQNWEKAKVVSKAKLHRQRMKTLQEKKIERDSEEASKLNENAEVALEAEKAAEEELEKAAKAMESATSEEEKHKAEKAKRKAKKQALQMKEKRLRATLKASCQLRSKPRIDAAVEESKEELPEIPTLKPDIEVAEKVLDSIKCGDNLDEAMAKRSLEDIESSVETIKKKGYGNDHTTKLKGAQKLAQKLKRLEKLKKEIMELNQRTISEIRSYKKPLPAIHDVMTATYVILGYKEKDLKDWKYILSLLGKSGKEGLKRQCTTLDASNINMKVAGVADQNYLSKHDLETITDISAGAATFFVWSTAMIEEARSWNEDSELREQLMAKKKKEEEEVRLLTEEKSKRANPKRKRSVTNKKQQQRRKSISSDDKDKAPKKDGEKSTKPPASPNTDRKNRSPTPNRKNLKPDHGGAKSRSRSKSPGKNKSTK